MSSGMAQLVDELIVRMGAGSGRGYHRAMSRLADAAQDGGSASDSTWAPVARADVPPDGRQAPADHSPVVDGRAPTV
ncbi:hypothetical protein OG905_37970 [Streptomyces sp. NBC_00322]|uniref:hypothetical protein n=1 Tax=Streptomyces sp. NBC_00322 TaxID=2975712 RepID=UPI002E2881B7|nr:hypothetical protein [Streptomyces sp. NBC_00322]